MIARWIAMSTFACCLLLVWPALSQEKDKEKDDKEEKFLSGPQVGKTLPSPFDVFNINGEKAKDRIHCLVCEYGLDPVVMIFARETEEGKDEALTELVQKLETATEKYQDDYLRAFVVYMSPAGRSSASEAKIEDPAKLVKEAEERNALHARLKVRAEKLKNVIISYTVAEGPKGYAIHPKAEYTVVYYRKLKVIDNHAFEAGKMTSDDVGAIMDKVEKSLRENKKPAVVKKKGPSV